METHYDDCRNVVVIGRPIEVPLLKEEYDAIQEITGNRFGEFYEEDNKGRVRIKDSHVTYLDGSRLELAALPESIGNLSGLENLYLCENRLVNLPESIGNLKRLDSLWLGGNPRELYHNSAELIRGLADKGVGIFS